MANKNKNYPLYQTTVFPDFRIMSENVANRFPKRIAFSYRVHPQDKEVVTVTYPQARDRVRDLGTGMIALDARDKKIAIIGESTYEWAISYFALMSIGSVTVPIDKDLPAENIAAILNAAECAFVFYSAAIEEKIVSIRGYVSDAIVYICMGESKTGYGKNLDAIAADGARRFAAGDNGYYDYDLDPDKLASIVFTSGTTGKGKGVMLSQTNIVSDMTQGMYNFDITPKTMCVLPLHHTFGSTVNLVGHFAQGSEIYFSSGLRYFAAEMKEQQPTHLILVPLFVETLYKRIWATAEKNGKADTLREMIAKSNKLRKAGIDLRHVFFKSVLSSFGGKLGMIICGGAALNQDVIDFYDGIGVTILNGYGITECSPLISCNRNKYQKSGSVGTPIIGEKIKILDPDENGEGEICAKGPNVMLGYFNNPEATAAAFDADGYFKTGDYGKLDDEGWIYITGRLKNLILFRNGKNVYPEEIETEVSRIRGVNEVIVYAGESKSHPEKELIVAEIFPDYETLTADGIVGDEAVQQYFEAGIKETNARTVSYKAVNLVKIRKEEFVKNTSKKILRFAIDRTVD